MSYGAAGRQEALGSLTELKWVDEIIQDLKKRASLPNPEALYSHLPAIERPVFNIYNPTANADHQSIAAGVMFLYGKNKPKEITSWPPKNVASEEISHYVSRQSLERQAMDKLNQMGKVVLKGMGGMGKTVLASHILRTRSERIKIWFDAENRQRLYEQYEVFLMDCDLLPLEKRQEIANYPYKTQIIINVVKKYFAEHGNWLIVYDNAGTNKEIEQFLPSSRANGKVIITSRNREWSDNNIIKVDEMTEVEATQLVAKIATDKHKQEDIKALTKELGYFPLAIAQAAAFMAEQRVSIHIYLIEYQSRKTQLLQEEGPADHIHVSAWVTFVLALEKIYENDPLAAGLLYYTGWLAANDIPLTLLGCIHYQNSEWLSSQLIIKRALAVLEKYSLLKGSGKDEKVIYSVHCVLQKFLQVSVSSEIEMLIIERLARSFLKVLDKDEYQIIINQWALFVHFDKLLSYISMHSLESKVIASALNKAAKVHNRLANYNSLRLSMSYLQQALSIHKNQSDEHSLAAAETFNNLGTAYCVLGGEGNLHQSIIYYEKAKVIREAKLEKDHPAIADALNNLGIVYETLGGEVNLCQAITYYKQALKIREKRLGEHPAVADSLNNLGTAYCGIGGEDNFRQAITYYEKALAISERQLVKDHPAIADTLNNLGRVYKAQGGNNNVLEAITYYNKALVIKEKQLGKDHPAIALILNNLGAAHKLLGGEDNFRQAITYYEKALAISEKQLDINHSIFASTLWNMALVQEAVNNKQAAISCWRKALAIYKSHNPLPYQEINIVEHAIARLENTVDPRCALAFRVENVNIQLPLHSCRGCAIQ